MSERKIITCTAYDDDALCETPTPFVQWVTSVLQLIPEQHRAEATIQTLGSGSSYVQVSYSRPETDAEMRQRLESEQRRIEAAQLNRERHERATLAALLMKYGDPRG